jgi:predicted O-linked N-acetylglucosamine transferase (SPINDLY family)/predicted SAM-dependent methyltransferase
MTFNQKSKAPNTMMPQDQYAKLEAAVTYHQAGDLETAADIYREVLSVDSENSDALHLLGVVAHQRGKNDTATELIEKAIGHNRKAPAFFNNLGNAYSGQGQVEKALQAYSEAVRLRPEYDEAHYNLGTIHQAKGEADKAVEHLKEAVRIRPNFPEALNQLGAVLMAQGEFNKAGDLFLKALRIKPDYCEALNNMGLFLHEQGRFSEAVQCFRDAIRLKEDFAKAYNNLGNTLEKMGRVKDAEKCHVAALQLQPDYSVAHYNLGSLFLAQGRLDEAVGPLQEAIRLDPAFSEAHNNLGNVFRRQGKLEDAKQCFSEAIRLKPRSLNAVNNLGNVLKDQGRLEEAEAAYSRVLAKDPASAKAHSNLLFCLNYRSGLAKKLVFEEHQRWANVHASPRAVERVTHANSPEPDRRLKIGYVSPNFYRHSVAYFIEPVLSCHDRDRFQVICYSDVSQADAVTERFADLADKWRDTHGMDDGKLAELIRDDSVDILVDLAGHTGNNRLLVFARKPSPVQVTYLGYPNTTGVPEIDYRITDGWADPPDGSDPYHSEKLVRLPNGFLCYQPAMDGLDVSSLPAFKTGKVTFGSFNNLSKVTEEVIALWAQILKRVPSASLLIKSRALADHATCRDLRGNFANHGIAENRIELIGPIPSFSEHMALYNKIDIGLDPFPYNGTTTTCEALWMGVPVVVLAGDRHASRVGVSLLSNIGQGDLITETFDDYVDRAVRLADDVNKLGTLRKKLRNMMLRSKLTDRKRFTCSLEDAYREMWKNWCQKSTPSSEGWPIEGGSVSSNKDNRREKHEPKSGLRRLHIGGNTLHPDWEVLNASDAFRVDHIADARDLSQFDDEVFSEIYASHVLEHFDYVNELGDVLTEWNRVLMPGGKLYVSVPDMEKLAQLFLMKKSLNIQERFHVMRMIFGGHTNGYEYHKVGFNREILESYLQDSGFGNLKAVDDFGIFKDTSKMRFSGIPISINIIAEKAQYPRRGQGREVPARLDLSLKALLEKLEYG